MLEEEL